jgi:hypothetical protein
MDDAFGYWFSGLTDGEGCFTLNGTAVHVHPGFHIGLRGDDGGLIEEIYTQLGFGCVYHEKHDRPDGKRRQSRWAARTKSDCAALVEIFDRYPLRSKKARDYMIWREAVEVWAPQRYCREHDRLREFRAALKEVRRFSPLELRRCGSP